MNEQVFKPVENYVNDFKNPFIITLITKMDSYMIM